MSSQFDRRKFLIGTAGAATSAWLLAACSSGDSGTGGTPQASASAIPQADIDKALDTETTLTFWTWVPDIKNQVDLFMKAYPKIKVNIVNVGQGAPHYQKLRTAIQAGQGGPDVAQMEFQFIPSFTLGDGSLLDLTPYAPADIASQFPEWVWGQVNANNGFWGVPQDTGPMGLLYRDDLLSDAGVDAAQDLGRLRRRRRHLPDQEPQELPGQRGPQPGRSDHRLHVAARCSPLQVRRSAVGDRRPGQRPGQAGGEVLGRPGHLRGRLGRHRLHRPVVPGTGQRQVRLLARRRVGAGLPAGHRRQDLREVAGLGSARSGASDARSRPTGAGRPTRC